MQLGFASAILPDVSFTQLMGIARDLCFDCVEVMCWPVSRAERRYAGVTHLDVLKLNDPQRKDAEIAEVLQVVEETGVRISALGYYPNPLDPDPAVGEAAVTHLQQVIRAARALGLQRVNTFVGRDWRKSVDDNWPRFLQEWRPLIQLAEDQGVRVGIENCPMSFTSDEWPGGKNLATSPAIWERMFSDIPSAAFGLNYDPSHMIWQQMDYLQPMWDFRDRLFHIHAKDVRLDRARLDRVGILAHPNDYHTPKLPGLGDVDWGQFFSILTDTGYQGPVCIEVEDRAYEGELPRRIESLAQSGDFLRGRMPGGRPGARWKT